MESSLDVCSNPDGSDADEVRMAVVVVMGSAVCAMGIIFNSFLLLSFSRLSILQSSMLYFFLLAIFDILVEICFVLIFVVNLVWDYYRIYPLYAAWHYYIRYISTIGQVLIVSSTLLIVTASLERYVSSLRSSMGFSISQRIIAVSLAMATAVFLKVFNTDGSPVMTYRIRSSKWSIQGSVFFELELHVFPQCAEFSVLQLGLSDITRSENYRNLWMFWGRSILNVIMPFSLLLLLNAATIFNLNKSSKDIESVLVEQLPSLLRTPSSEASSSARRRKRDATRTLAAIVSFYLVANSLNMIITILEFLDQGNLMQMGNGWTYKYLSDLSSLLTISSTAFRLPVYFHCNRDLRAQIRETAQSCASSSPKIMAEKL